MPIKFPPSKTGSILSQVKTGGLKTKFKAQSVRFQGTSNFLPTVDGWQAGTDYRRAKAYSLAALTSIAFVPLVSPSTIYINAQNSEPQSVQGFQYQAKAEPLVVTQTETVTQDKWGQPTQAPVRPLRRSPVEWIVTDGQSLIQPERASLDKWVVRIEQPVMPRATVREGGSTLVRVDTFPVDRFIQPQSEVRRTQRRVVYDSTSFIQIISAPAQTIFIGGQSSEPIAIQSFQYQGRVEPVSLSAERVSADKWAQPQSEPRRVRRIQIPTDSRIFLVSAEVVTVDKWARANELPARLKRLPDYGRSIILSVPRTSLDWLRQTEAPIRLQARRDTATSFVLTADESLTIDKWLSVLPEIFRRSGWRQYEGASTLGVAPPTVDLNPTRSASVIVLAKPTATVSVIEMSAIVSVEPKPAATLIVVEPKAALEVMPKVSATVTKW